MKIIVSYRFNAVLTLILSFILILTPQVKAADESYDFNTVLMRSTFKIVGANKSTGTVFILGKPAPNGLAKKVLVTATHVLQGIQGDTAQLYLRTKNKDKYTKTIVSIRIRENGKSLWLSHPNADVSVMYIALPKEIF